MSFCELRPKRSELGVITLNASGFIAEWENIKHMDICNA